MCTFCVVPFTRGRERSRDPQSILAEINDLRLKGYKEVTLLGQNVDSYLWYGGGLKKDFKKASDLQKVTATDFSKLLDLCANSQPKMRFRFSTSNPQDMSIDVIKTMAKYENICNYIHLPVQSGSNRILKKMKRDYTVEHYISIIERLRDKRPDLRVSTDIIVGFPGETDEDFLETLNVINEGQFDSVYMFKFSPRPGTKANSMQDEYVSKSKIDSRFMELKKIQTDISHSRLQRFIGTHQHVLIEKYSKKTNDFLTGKIDGGQTTHIKAENVSIGDFVEVEIVDATPFALTAVLL